MKKLISAFIFFICANAAFAYEYKAPVTNDIKDSQSVVYDLQTKEWSKAPADVEKDCAFENKIIFTKFMTKGSGGFSEYETAQKQYEAGVGSTYEFLDGKELIGYNSHTLKFYKLDFNGEKIAATELTPNEVKKYFPDVEIVKISQFKNNKIELKKPWFKPKTFMLLNDTNTDFYKYQFENQKDYQLVRGVFEVPKSIIAPKTLVFSHFASRDKLFPALTIKIRNGF